MALTYHFASANIKLFHINIINNESSLVICLLDETKTVQQINHMIVRKIVTQSYKFTSFVFSLIWFYK